MGIFLENFRQKITLFLEHPVICEILDGIRNNDFYQQPLPGVMPPFFTSDIYVPAPQGATLPLANNPSLEALVNAQNGHPQFPALPLTGPMNALQQLENVAAASIQPNGNFLRSFMV